MKSIKRRALDPYLGTQFVAYHDKYGASSALSISEERLNSWNKEKDNDIDKVQSSGLRLRKGELFEVEPFTFIGVDEGQTTSRPTFVASPFFIPNAFYPVVLIDFMFFNYTFSHFVILPADRLPLDKLKALRFQVGLIKGEKKFFWEVDLAKFDSQFWSNQESYVIKKMGYHDTQAAYCLSFEGSLKTLDNARKYTIAVMSQSDDNKAAFSYWRRMELEAKSLCSANALSQESFMSEKESMHELTKDFPLGDLPSMFTAYHKAFEEDPAKWLKESFDLIRLLIANKAFQLAIQTQLLQRLFLFLVPQMQEGLRFPSLFLDAGIGIEFVALNAEVLDGKFEEFWHEVPIGYNWSYDKVIGSGNIHVSKAVFNANCPKYEEDIPEVIDFIKAQLEEATRLKEWTLPFGGLFQLVGPVAAVKTFEINNDVHFVFCFQNGRYFHLILTPGTQSYSISPDRGDIAFRGEDGSYTELDGKIDQINDRHILALILISSSIIRDAWVVEERESVFGEGRLTRKISPLLGDHRKKIVVYLPRIKYIKKQDDISRAKEELNYAVRRQHWVKGHLRKAVKASPAQILLAQRHGVYIPDGRTYVQGHNRGQLAAERIYRSRSALKCLRALDGIGLGVDGWFSFEKNVKQWLDSFGYETDHKAASRNGDGGIDIQASKGSDSLLVQCKYWRDPVGINVVREMIGTLITYPAGSRGVIVTSSELTIPAKELAIQHNIQFVENVSFEKAIDKDLKGKS